MKRNLGIPERALRLLLGLVGSIVVYQQSAFGTSEGIVMILSIFLILNGLLGRCYLWKALGLDTSGKGSCEFDERAGD